MNLVVSDTGPLLHLFQAGAVELLAHWGTIHVTPQVWLELHRHAPGFSAKGVPAWLRQCELSPAASQQAAQWVQARVLDPGEAEALAYAREIRRTPSSRTTRRLARSANRWAFRRGVRWV